MGNYKVHCNELSQLLTFIRKTKSSFSINQLLNLKIEIVSLCSVALIQFCLWHQIITWIRTENNSWKMATWRAQVEPRRRFTMAWPLVFKMGRLGGYSVTFRLFFWGPSFRYSFPPFLYPLLLSTVALERSVLLNSVSLEYK